MRVVKRGKPKAQDIFKGECHDCHSVVEAERHELKVTDDQRDGEFGETACPICKARLILYPKAGR